MISIIIKLKTNANIEGAIFLIAIHSSFVDLISTDAGIFMSIINNVNAIAKQNNLLVIEDAAQSHGAVSNHKKAGTLSDAAAFSFYPGKNLGACGEAGALVTNRADFAARARSLGGTSRRRVRRLRRKATSWASASTERGRSVMEE